MRPDDRLDLSRYQDLPERVLKSTDRFRLTDKARQQTRCTRYQDLPERVLKVTDRFRLTDKARQQTRSSEISRLTRTCSEGYRQIQTDR